MVVSYGVRQDEHQVQSEVVLPVCATSRVLQDDRHVSSSCHNHHIETILMVWNSNSDQFRTTRLCRVCPEQMVVSMPVWNYFHSPYCNTTHQQAARSIASETATDCGRAQSGHGICGGERCRIVEGNVSELGSRTFPAEMPCWADPASV